MLHDARKVIGLELSPENEGLLEALGVIHDETAARLLDGVAERRPAEWTPELVKDRLSAAAEHFERYERRVGPDRKLTS